MTIRRVCCSELILNIIYRKKHIIKMDRSSFFIKDKALFGSFPTQDAVEELETTGVRYFIDLTHSHETKIVPYETRYTYISFPIPDRRIPVNILEFSSFIVKLSDIILGLGEGEIIYVHCKGGHGRSGVVVACLLSFLFNMEPSQALARTSIYHNNRKDMREKWRKIGSPQTYQQKKFIYLLCKPVIFFRAYKTGKTAGFSNFTCFPVHIEGFGTFPSSEAAIQAYKNPSDEEYVKKQENARTPVISKRLGNKIFSEDWENNKEKLMVNILRCKFDQNPYIKEVLLNTYLSPIVYDIKRDDVWGVGMGDGQNLLGKALCKIKTEYQRSM